LRRHWRITADLPEKIHGRSRYSLRPVEKIYLIDHNLREALELERPDANGGDHPVWIEFRELESDEPSEREFLYRVNYSSGYSAPEKPNPPPREERQGNLGEVIYSVSEEGGKRSDSLEVRGGLELSADSLLETR
jgi:hypothetical protein